MSSRATIAAMLAAVFVLLIALSVTAALFDFGRNSRLPFRMLCHGRSERCLTVNGVAMPVCSRCIGLYAGALAGIGAALLFRRRLPGVVALIAAMPLLVDGSTQALGLRESTNALRLVTGVIAGGAALMWAIGSLPARREEVLERSETGGGEAGVKS